MNAADFRRVAFSLEGAEEGSHIGAPDFRVIEIEKARYAKLPFEHIPPK